MKLLICVGDCKNERNAFLKEYCVAFKSNSNSKFSFLDTILYS